MMLILLGHFVPLGILSALGIFSFRRFVLLGILSLWAFCLFRHNVFWAFYPVGHFVVLGQNVFWAFYPWAFCHTWAFCHFGHFIIESEKGEGKQNKNKANSFTLALYFGNTPMQVLTYSAHMPY